MVFLFLSSIIPIIAATAVTKEGVRAIDRSTRAALPERKKQQGIFPDVNIRAKPLGLGVRPINIGKPININAQGILKGFKQQRGLI